MPVNVLSTLTSTTRTTKSALTLLQDADIFIQGFRYGILDSKGLGRTEILKVAVERNKGIIYVDENCYGQFGPFATRQGWQQIADAASGISYVFGQSLGYEEGHSVSPSIPVAGMTAVLAGVLAAMMAIRDRASKGVEGVFSRFHFAFGGQHNCPTAPDWALSNLNGTGSCEEIRFQATTADQHISELSFDVVDRWKKVMPDMLREDSRGFTTFEDELWQLQSLLKPVVRLSEGETTPRWATPSVPNCYIPRMLSGCNVVSMLLVLSKTGSRPQLANLDHEIFFQSSLPPASLIRNAVHGSDR